MRVTKAFANSAVCVDIALLLRVPQHAGEFDEWHLLAWLFSFHFLYKYIRLLFIDAGGTLYTYRRRLQCEMKKLLSTPFYTSFHSQERTRTHEVNRSRTYFHRTAGM